MKTKSFVLAAFLVVLGTLSTVAENDPTNTGLSVVSRESGVYKLIYDGGKPSPVNVTILNSKGQVVYAETLRNVRGFIRPVNFNGMGADAYTIRVNNGSEKLETVINYVPETKRMTVSSRKLEDGKFAILVSNAGEETIEVKMYDAYDNLIQTHTEQVHGSFGKIFNVAQIKSSSYRFEVYSSKGLLDVVTLK
jgi:hypothetical protein